MSRAEVLKVIEQINQQMAKPHSKPLTSNGMKSRADYLKQVATGIKLHGGEVKPEYEYEG